MVVLLLLPAQSRRDGAVPVGTGAAGTRRNAGVPLLGPGANEAWRRRVLPVEGTKERAAWAGGNERVLPAMGTKDGTARGAKVGCTAGAGWKPKTREAAQLAGMAPPEKRVLLPARGRKEGVAPKEAENGASSRPEKPNCPIPAGRTGPDGKGAPATLVLLAGSGRTDGAGTEEGTTADEVVQGATAAPKNAELPACGTGRPAWPATGAASWGSVSEDRHPQQAYLTRNASVGFASSSAAGYLPARNWWAEWTS
jgi:hypothetical protein